MPALVYLFGGALAGGLVPLAAGAWAAQRRKVKGTLGPDEETLARIASLTVDGAKDMLAEYRIELEVAKRQILAYRDEITQLNRLSGLAQQEIAELRARIVQLERLPGPAGATGATGETGATGDTGATGRTGAPGKDGH